MAIEKKFIQESVNRLLIKEYLQKETMRAGFGGLDIQRTPMGTRISILAERPGMIIGRRGGTINALTDTLAKRFKAENPQIEVVEAGRSASLNAQIMATKLAEALERGWHFRRAGHSTVQRIMESGARGCIVIIAGKLTGQRHRTEKFVAGHIKYCGDTAEKVMDIGYNQCIKKIGVIGCTVKIMRPDARMPDEVTVLEVAKPAPAAAPAHAAERPREHRPRERREGERKPRPKRDRKPKAEKPAPAEASAGAPAEARAEEKPAEARAEEKPAEAPAEDKPAEARAEAEETPATPAKEPRAEPSGGE